MKIKSLLLGSAAVLSVVGVAQAADQPAKPAQAVKPVSYVTICEAFGLGFMYIPGHGPTGNNQTCFRLQGQIQFNINFHSRAEVGPYDDNTRGHEAAWDSQAQGQLTFTARRMTDRGDLVGVVRMVGTSNNEDTAGFVSTDLIGGDPVPDDVEVPTDRIVRIDRAYIQYGGLEVGYNSSLYGIGTTKHVNFTWELGSVEAGLGFDDPRDRWGTRLARLFWMPDVVGSVTGDLPGKGRGTWGISAGLANMQTPSSSSGNNPSRLVWGVSARTTINLPALGKGDQLTFSGTVGTGCAFISNNCGQGTATTGNTMYQVIAQFRHVFTPTFRTDLQIRYTDPNPAQVRTDAQAQITWVPINIGGFTTQVQVTGNQTLFTGMDETPSALSGQLRFQLVY
jgi:hypothetical protein